MVNKVILVGNLGANPELKQVGDTPVCNLRVATSERWTDRDGQKQERTEWHSVDVWGKQAEHCARYLSKGRKVYVEGTIQSRKYTDKDGVECTAYGIKAMTVQFLDRAEDGGSTERPASGGGSWGKPAGAKPKADGWGSKGGGSWGGGGGGGAGFDDGPGFDDPDPIPF